MLEGESLGSFDHMRTLMTQTVSIVHGCTVDMVTSSVLYTELHVYSIRWATGKQNGQSSAKFDNRSSMSRNRQFCELQIFRKTDCHIQFAVKMSNTAGRLETYTNYSLMRMRRTLIISYAWAYAQLAYAAQSSVTCVHIHITPTATCNSTHLIVIILLYV